MKIQTNNLLKQIFKQRKQTSKNSPLTTKTAKTTITVGATAESIACTFLTKKGLTLVERNYRCPQGEIDLIMQERDITVFIEVRYRKHNNYGTPSETVNYNKLKRVNTAINHYTMTNNLGYIPCRIDVIGLHGNLEQPTIKWLKNVIAD